MMAGAAAVAPRLCKVDGCSRPVRGRGMCINCYEKWRRANPGVRVQLQSMDMVEELLPARQKVLSEKTGMTLNSIAAVLKRLHEAGRARIGHYDPPTVTGASFRPVWVAGPGRHAPKPSKKKLAEYSRHTHRRNYARRKGRAWAAALGVGQ